MQEKSEATYFARIEQACQANDAAAAYRALSAWARRIGATSIAAWCAEAGDGALRNEIAGLEHTLFAQTQPTDTWQGDALASALAGARQTWLNKRVHAGARPTALPALNPEKVERAN
jgi:hypothetical protein